MNLSRKRSRHEERSKSYRFCESVRKLFDYESPAQVDLLIEDDKEYIKIFKELVNNDVACALSNVMTEAEVEDFCKRANVICEKKKVIMEQKRLQRERQKQIELERKNLEQLMEKSKKRLDELSVLSSVTSGVSGLHISSEQAGILGATFERNSANPFED